MAGTAPAAPIRSPIYRVTRVLTWLIYAFAVVAIAFLATSFFLKLLNANEAAPFVKWVDRATRILMQPFRGIFPAVEAESGSVFDASLLFAMLMYGMLAMGMHALLDWIDRRMAAARTVQSETYARSQTATPREAGVVEVPPARAPMAEARAAPADPSAGGNPSGSPGGRATA